MPSVRAIPRGALTTTANRQALTLRGDIRVGVRRAALPLAATAVGYQVCFSRRSG
jgi:hypothetical protein